MAGTTDVNLGRIGFTCQPWSSTASYTTRDFVWYENSLYLPIQNVSAGVLPTNTDYYTRVIKGIIPRGSWDANATYDMNDVIIFSGKAYWCKTNGVTSPEPPSVSDDWLPMPNAPLNAGFGIGNRYSVSTPASGLTALWNLIHNGSIDGQQTLYGMTGRTMDYTIKLLTTKNAPIHDFTMTYNEASTITNSNRRIMASGVPVTTNKMNITDGETFTVRCLAYLSSNNAYSPMYMFTTSLENSDYTSGTYGFFMAHTGSYLQFGIRTGSTTRTFFNSSSSSSSVTLANLINLNDINEFVVVVTRTSNGYSYKSFVNGQPFQTGNAVGTDYNYDCSVNDYYLGLPYSTSYANYYSRGMAQLEVYDSDIIGSSAYTPEYKLLSEPSI